MKIGDTIRGEIETFTITAISDNTKNPTVTYKGEDGNLWQTRAHNIGSDDNGLIIGEEAYHQTA